MCIFYINIKIKVVPKVKYLGLFFDDTADSSPGAEDREAPAERARYGFMTKLKNMGPMTVADKIRMEFSMVGSVASFGSQILGVNYLEITKGLNNCFEVVHMRFLQNVLDVGNKVSHDVVREDAGSPAYHSHWVISVFQK